MRRNERKRKARPKVQPGDHYTHRTYRQALIRACDKAYPLPANLRRQSIVGPKGRELESVKVWHARIGASGVAAVKAWRHKHSFSPHQLQHSAGTTLRREFDIETARIMLGHSSAFTTELYAKRDTDQAKLRRRQ